LATSNTSLDLLCDDGLSDIFYIGLEGAGLYLDREQFSGKLKAFAKSAVDMAGLLQDT